MRNDTRPFHQSLALTNFTAFSDVNMEFVPGVNVIIGENGTGKTHILKALYAVHSASRNGFDSVRGKLARVFQVNLDSLIRRSQMTTASAKIEGSFGGTPWLHEFYKDGNPGSPIHDTLPVDRDLFPKEVVFIPAIDMMGHTKGFLSIYQHREIDFDETLNDIVANLLLPPLKELSGEQAKLIEGLEKILGGKLELEGERFYLTDTRGRFEMPAIAEGLRKVATLIRLVQVGALGPGSTLFWDEPEVNLNPIIMDEVVGAILALARSGVQVFLATHSYVILKELDLQLGMAEEARFFALNPAEAGTEVSSFDDFTQLQPNAILDQYSSLYDRELSRATRRPVKRAN